VTSLTQRFSTLISRMVADRSRLPKFVDRLIDDVAKRPDGLPARLVDFLLNLSSEPATPTDVPTSSLRVFIGPTNYSGQGFAWSRSLERQSGVLEARNLEVELPGGFHFAANSKVSVSQYNRSRKWQQAEFNAVREFTHVLYEAERPLFGAMFGRDIRREINSLRESHVSVALMCHGTDVRSPRRHRDLTRWSPYADQPELSRQHQREVDQNLALIDALKLPTFVSTPDLLLDVPHAHWCPVVVDGSVWRTSTIPLKRRKPVVVHVPSMGVIKGTHMIEETLIKLHDEGLIDYRPFRGVAAREMPALISGADVVLDQFRIGSYGVAAVEAMFAGRVVVGHVAKKVRDMILKETGCPVPIVEATPETLELVLREISRQGSKFHEVAHAGLSFAQEVHDGRYSSSVLEKYWIHNECDASKKERR
jgi:hypothetical protein